MNVRKRLPRLGLYSRFLILFSVTAALLAATILLGSFTYREDEIKELIAERHEHIFDALTKFHGKDIDLERIREQVDGPKVELKIVRGDSVWTTWDEFPDINQLKTTAEQIGSLYFVKHGFRYYLLAQKDETEVAATAHVVNLLVYPGLLAYWPWFIAVLVFALSYQVLRHWLRPIADSLKSAQHVSKGDFNYRIINHPHTELADLTKGLNQMTRDLKQLFDAKHELLLAISHELRTPLARMKISLALLNHGPAVDDLNNDIHYMDDLIEQLLEGERLQQGHQVLHISTYYLPRLIEDILEEQTFQQRVTVSNGVPEVAITADIGRIKFLLRNLLNNAIEYSSEEQSVTLTIEQNDEEFIFHVADQGCGIPENAMKKIFEPFFSTENIKHRSTKGVGLGLYLCNKIANAHSGSLSVKSNVNSGSCFTLRLPK